MNGIVLFTRQERKKELSPIGKIKSNQIIWHDYDYDLTWPQSDDSVLPTLSQSTGQPFNYLGNNWMIE